MEIGCTLGIENRKEAKCMGADNRGSHLTKEERKIIARKNRIIDILDSGLFYFFKLF